MINIALRADAFGPRAVYELGLDGLPAEIVVKGFRDDIEDDSYEDVARQMCRALALLGFRGEVSLFYNGTGDEEDKREIFATIDRLKDTLRITEGDVRRVAAEEHQNSESLEAGLKKMGSAMKQEGLKRGLNKEERQRLTLGELYTEGDD